MTAANRRTSATRRPGRVIAALTVAGLLAAACGHAAARTTTHTPTEPPATSTPAPSGGPGPGPTAVDPTLLEQARQHIKHVVFIVKENRTFDTYFGQYPGADGARWGKTCHGPYVRLRHAHDSTPDVEHHFIPAIRAID